MRLVFLGSPGSGKSTQAGLVSEKIEIPRIATGDLLRDAVARDTDIGRKADVYMKRGELVPDDVMLPLVERRLGEPDCSDGYVLDGFPRTLAQAIGLEEILARREEALDRIILIDVDAEHILKRLSRRRVCTECSTLYNLDADPPRESERCNKCGCELVLRDDDAEETVRKRLRVYRSDTFPLVEYYEAGGLLRKVDGVGDIEAVFAKILDEISEPRRS
jgi:adenylate kinase